MEQGSKDSRKLWNHFGNWISYCIIGRTFALWYGSCDFDEAFENFIGNGPKNIEIIINKDTRKDRKISERKNSIFYRKREPMSSQFPLEFHKSTVIFRIKSLGSHFVCWGLPLLKIEIEELVKQLWFFAQNKAFFVSKVFTVRERCHILDR